MAADLELFGYVRTTGGMARLDPRPAGRRLLAAWHMGRLRALLPQRVDTVVDTCDRWLAGLAVMSDYSDHQLLELLDHGTERLEGLHHQEVLAGTLLGAEPGTGGEAVPDFRWLAPPAQTHVFIPILLATGMVVSVIAAAVESVAVAVQRRRRTQPVLTRDHVSHPVLAYAAFLVGLAAATVLASLGLYQVTHHWAGPQRAGTTELTVQVSVKDRALRTTPMVEAAGRYCALNSGAGASYESVEQESRDTALLHLTPSLDQAAQDRYVGCIEDTLLERTQLEVTSVRSTPVRLVVDPR